MARSPLTSQERFWLKVNKDGPVLNPELGHCWEWTACLASKSRYGLFFTPGRTGVAHRFAYEWLVGPIPDGLTLDHLCRNRACVNPAHLEPVLPRTNVLRGVGVTAHNAAKTHCKRGHPLTPENVYYRKGGRQCRLCNRERYVALTEGKVRRRWGEYRPWKPTAR